LAVVAVLALELHHRVLLVEAVVLAVLELVHHYQLRLEQSTQLLLVLVVLVDQVELAALELIQYSHL
jgi:hypothetical protein